MKYKIKILQNKDKASGFMKRAHHFYNFAGKTLIKWRHGGAGEILHFYVQLVVNISFYIILRINKDKGLVYILCSQYIIRVSKIYYIRSHF